MATSYEVPLTLDGKVIGTAKVVDEGVMEVRVTEEDLLKAYFQTLEIHDMSIYTPNKKEES